MKLRVAYLVSRFPHLPETFILREMVELENQGVKVDLFPLVIQDQDVIHAESQPWMKKLYHQSIYSLDCLQTNFRKFIHHPGIYFSTFFRIFWFNIPSSKFLLRAIYIFPVAVWMAEKMEALQVDHIHAHYATHPALAAYIISRFTGIPYSFTVHAHDIFVNRTMLRQKIGNAAFVRAISKFNKDFLCRQYGDWTAGKTHVVHCGIRPEMYQTEIKKKPNIFQITAVGSLQPYKGHEYLIRACKILKENSVVFHCQIIGGGARYTELSSLIKELGLDDHVELLGPKTERQVADLLVQSHCFVLPSVIMPSGKMEGIPVVLMEALASKLAVAAVDISGIPEIIEDGITGLLISQRDSLALAERMRWFYEHPQESRKMAEKGCQKVINEFNVEKNGIELKKLFSQYKKK